MMRRANSPLILLLALTAVTACGRKGARRSDFDNATAAALAAGGPGVSAASMPKVAHIAGVDLGRQLDRHGMIFGGTAQQFAIGDSLLVSVRGVYLPVGAEVTARIRSKTTTLDSASAKAPAPDTAGVSIVGLRFATGKTWRKGTYQLDVLLNGTFQMSQDFSLGQ